MKTLFAVLAVVATFLTGCGSTSTKNLTPSSAKQLLQERLRMEQQEDGLYNYQPILERMSMSTFLDYRQDSAGNDTAPPAVIRRMLKAGLVEQAAEKHSYPMLKGVYTAHDTTLNQRSISMSKDTRVIRGTYKYSECGGNISGELNGDGTITITILGTGGGWGWGCANTYSRTYGIARTPEGVKLADMGPFQFGNNGTGDFYCKGACEENALERSTYVYHFTPKFAASGATAGKVKVGKMHIDNVDQLLLGVTDTSAGGQFTWHMDYNAIGRVVTGVDGEHGTGTVTFRKQPDGAWICESHLLTEATPGLAKP